MTGTAAHPLSQTQRDDLLYRLAQEYRDLNGTSVDVRAHAPSAIEFARIVNVGRPVLFKKTPSPQDLPALMKWTNEYLINSMGDRKLSVAVTPDGRADALCTLPNGTQCFAEPHTEHLTMSELLNAIVKSERDPSSEVYYLQSQNGNMYTSADFEDDVVEGTSELLPLLGDVPKEVPWASEALDPYENIYTVIRGAKHFTLLPPTEGYTLHEQRVPHARYTRPSPSSLLHLESLVPPSTVRWASVDPFEHEHALHVTVQEGQSLYLPAGWWHRVAQTGDREGVCVAVNWWYDVEMSGMKWVWMSFLRRMAAPEGDEENED
ncbi:hypothetical protein FRC09_018638 [Ceratobasidium sp. 395]|nr:hypothetical protein FRC09_018638 [Ceratobasidium sp. 395]